MGKRGAEDQLTKDDAEAGRGGRDDSDDENNVPKDAPKEVLATRQIRGIPKRKIAGAASSSTPSFGFGQPSASAAPPSFGAPVSSGLSGFSIGSPAAAPPSATTPSAFGAAPPATSAPFAFGAPATSTPSTSTAPSSKPFSGFSFGSGAATTTPASTSTTSTAAPATMFGSTTSASKASTSETSNASKTPLAGFSFSAPATKVNTPASTATSTPAAVPKVSTFGAFGGSSDGPTSAFGAKPTPVEQSKTAETPKTVNGFSSTAASSQATGQATAPKADEKEVEYLTSLRGLNESAVRALSVKIRDDPFINLASALESLKAEYSTYLEEITKRAGKSVSSVNGAEAHGKKRNATALEEDTSSMEPPHKKAETSKPSAAMPVPPVAMPSAGGFKLPAPATSTPSSTASGFKPSLPASDSATPALPAVGGFKLPTASSSSAPQTAAPAGFKPTLPSSGSATAKASPFAAFSFGQTAEKKDAPASTTPAATTTSSVPVPLFGAPASTTGGNTSEATEKRLSSRASLFAQSVIDEQNKEKTGEKETPATPSSAQKQSSIFAIKPTVKPAISDSMVVPSPSSTGASSFLFKAPSTPASASTTPSKLPTFSFNMGSSSDLPPTPKATAGFTFAPKPRTSSASFGFGFGKTGTPEKSSDANGTTEAESTTPSKPIAAGFSFGANVPRTTPKSSFPPPSSTPTGSLPKPAFSFGPTATAFSAPKPAASTTDSTAAASENEEAPADAGPQADLTVGAGEEDEETLWQGKVSIGSFGKFGAEGAAPTWGDWKLCILKLNKEKKPASGEQPMRRFLARIDPSGTIVQNFSLRSLSDMSLLTQSAYRMTVAGTDGIKQIALRFGKKKEGFDPAPMMEKLKTAIQTERTDMGLAELPSLKQAFV